MRFFKMHGTGNDFILFDIFRRPELEEKIAEKVVDLCDRHFGIGSDGVLLVCPSERADFRVVMYNPDGTQGQCGNGLRCFAKFVYENGLTDKTRFAVESLGGIVQTELTLDGERVVAVEVDMGPPRLSRAEIPMRGPDTPQVVLEPLRIEGEEFAITCVSMGNPHCVILTDAVDEVDLERWGPALEHHPSFPERTNVEFVQPLSPRELRVRVWERGAGITLACGTGACASAVAAHLAGETEREVTVHLPGGTLGVNWAPSGHVFLKGPAELVFVGEVDI